MPLTLIVREPFPREKLHQYILGDKGFVKAVVDCKKGIMAIGGELHADAEQVLMQDGSTLEDLWGINIHPEESPPQWIEFNSMINIRPSQGNKTKTVEDPKLREYILRIVSSLVT